MTCSLCDKPVRARGWCGMHYTRWQVHGDPNALLKKRSSEPAYNSVHLRLSRERGKASDYPCVDCERPAQEWSYRNGGGSKPFSVDLDEYEPRCVSCHRKLDKPPRLPCSADGCAEPHYGRGMCRKHYNRWYRSRVAKRNTVNTEEKRGNNVRR